MAFPGKREEVQASLWSGADRRRVRERFRATLAGLLELEVLRSKHRAMVDGALGKDRPRTGDACQAAGESANDAPGDYQYHVLGSAGNLRLTRSLSQETGHNTEGLGEVRTRTSWSTEELLLPQNKHHYQYKAPLRACVRFTASSGFCDDDGYNEDDAECSSLSSSCSSLCSRPLILQSEEEEVEGWGHTSSPVPTVGHAIPTTGFLSVAGLCPESHWWHVSTMLHTQVTLDPVYHLDLVCGQSQEVYRFPSPLHAVALQSPLYTSMQRPSQPSEDVRRTKSCSLPACLSAGPWRSGWSLTPRPEKHRLEKIFELAYRHRWPAAVESDAFSSSCRCRTCPRGRRGSGPAANHPLSEGRARGQRSHPNLHAVRSCGHQQEPNPTGENAEPQCSQKHRPRCTSAATEASLLL